MSKSGPSTLPRFGQMALLELTSSRPRETLLASPVVGAGLRLAERVALDVGDVYLTGGHLRVRVRACP